MLSLSFFLFLFLFLSLTTTTITTTCTHSYMYTSHPSSFLAVRATTGVFGLWTHDSTEAGRLDAQLRQLVSHFLLTMFFKRCLA
jgi:hypothetical protein